MGYTFIYMKNIQKGFIGIFAIVLIALAVIGGEVYVYSTQKSYIDVPIAHVDTTSNTSSSTTSNTVTPTISSNKTGLSDAVFLAAVGANATKVRARGDINGDGYEDAIVEEIHCGAGCSLDLEIVFNQKNTSAKLFNPPQYANFEPSYRGSSAIKSNVTDITIKNGIISFTGTALECPDSICDEAHRNTVRTVTYKFDGTKIVQLSVNPPLEQAKITKGAYEFGEFASGNGRSNQTWVYKLNIKNEGGVGDIALTVDGFQTMTNIYAKGVTSSQGSLDVVFDSYGQDNMFTPYKKGDVLFTLEPTYDGLSIEWKKMQPNLQQNVSGVFFSKSSF